MRRGIIFIISKRDQKFEQAIKTCKERVRGRNNIAGNDTSGTMQTMRLWSGYFWGHGTARFASISITYVPNKLARPCQRSSGQIERSYQGSSCSIADCSLSAGERTLQPALCCFDLGRTGTSCSSRVDQECCREDVCYPPTSRLRGIL